MHYYPNPNANPNPDPDPNPNPNPIPNLNLNPNPNQVDPAYPAPTLTAIGSAKNKWMERNKLKADKRRPRATNWERLHVSRPAVP